ncbi:unnamed protein product, partial [Effrenium voratum]
ASWWALHSKTRHQSSILCGWRCSLRSMAGQWSWARARRGWWDRWPRGCFAPAGLLADLPDVVPFLQQNLASDGAGAASAVCVRAEAYEWGVTILHEAFGVML